MTAYNIQLSPEIFNSVYLPYMRDQTRTQIFFGGSSSGKSIAIVGQRTVKDVLSGDRNFLIFRKVGRSSWSSTFNEVKKTIEAWKVEKLFTINKSKMVITCVNGCQILFQGLDDVEKKKSITPEKGVITDIIVEEATETTAADVKQLYKRLRGTSKVKKRVVLIFNPILKSHWIFKKFFSGKFFDDDKVYRDDKVSILRTTYKDNKFLEVDDIAELEDETDPYWRDVFTLGKWGTLGDVVYKNWKIQDLSGIKYFDNYKNGLDFGFSVAQTALVRSHYDQNNRTIYITDGFYETELENPQIAEWAKPIISNEYLYCDPAEPKSIAELQRERINALPAIGGPDSVRYGIQWLQQHKIIIDKALQFIVNEIELYQWKRDRDGEKINEPIKKRDHALDALRYSYSNEARRGSGKIEDIGPSPASMGDWDFS